jgi:pimeloyl-ACP methyl ester carboxylesterase
VVGNQADVFLPVEVGYAMRQAQYVSGSGTRSLTFWMSVAANDVDADGISLGRVNSSAVRDFDFTRPIVTPQVLDLAGNAASNVIPAVNTSRIRVDATGPVVAGYGAFATKGRQVSLKVTFDGPVTVKGKPTIPVTIGGDPYNLSYVAGSKTSTLTFAVQVPKGELVANPAFRGENGLPGEVIVLPKGADLKDRFGNSVTPIGGNFGQTYTYEGSHVVVIGTHFEKLKYGKSESVSQDDLNTILNEEQQTFRADEVEAIGRGEAPFWKGYVPSFFPPAVNDVDIYRVAYRSTIPEQGHRPTVAYGLVAIPKGATGSLPLVSSQHGALFLKESAPSQAFSWDKNDTTPFKYGGSQKQLYDSCYETRLNVAQFAGHGYAVIAADYFGLGNSVENDAFFVKGSAQQANLDMHAAAQKLFASLNLSIDKFFLNGWSQGGVVTLAFQEALEARGIKISGVSTASAASDMDMFINRFIFNARPYSVATETPPKVPDGAWCVFIPQFASFSLGGYSGKTNTPLELLGGNYEIARKFYMREFAAPPSFSYQKDVRGTIRPIMTLDGVIREAEISKFIDQKFTRDPRAFASSTFASLFRDVSVGKTRLESDMLMYYGDADEASPDSIATFIATWQRGTFGKTNLDQISVPFASHRGTFLTAVDGQLRWFDSKRGL